MLTVETIGGIIFLSLAVLLIITGFLLLRIEDGWSFSILVWVCALISGLPPLIGFGVVGFSSDYLTYKPVSGQVQQIASRQVADGKAMSTRYVVVIEGQPYGVDDTRAALLKVGDSVSLLCTKEFVWGSNNNGYACNWN